MVFVLHDGLATDLDAMVREREWCSGGGGTGTGTRTRRVAVGERERVRGSGEAGEKKNG